MASFKATTIFTPIQPSGRLDISAYSNILVSITGFIDIPEAIATICTTPKTHRHQLLEDKLEKRHEYYKSIIDKMIAEWDSILPCWCMIDLPVRKTVYCFKSLIKPIKPIFKQSECVEIVKEICTRLHKECHSDLIENKINNKKIKEILSSFDSIFAYRIKMKYNEHYNVHYIEVFTLHSVFKFKYHHSHPRHESIDFSYQNPAKLYMAMIHCKCNVMSDVTKYHKPIKVYIVPENITVLHSRIELATSFYL
jgi:hypothetical protein